MIGSGFAALAAYPAALALGEPAVAPLLIAGWTDLAPRRRRFRQQRASDKVDELRGDPGRQRVRVDDRNGPARSLPLPLALEPGLLCFSS